MQTVVTPAKLHQNTPAPRVSAIRRLLGSPFMWLIILLISVDAALIVLKPLRFVHAGGLMFADCDPLTDKVHALGSPTKNYNTLLLGSSLAVTATALPDFVRSGKKEIQTEELKRYTQATYLDQVLSKALGVDLHSFNASLYGCVICEDLALFKAVLKNDSPPKLVILLAAPRDFIDNQILPEESSHVISYLKDEELGFSGSSRSFHDNFDSISRHLFRFYQVRSDYGRLAQLLTCGWLNRAPDLFSATAATKKTKFASNAAISIGPAGGAAGGMDGHVLRDERVSAKDLEKDRQGYVARYLPVDKRRCKRELANIASFLDIAKAKGIVPLVVNMPLERANYTILPADFLAQYRKELRELCADKKCAYQDFIDNQDFVSDQDFLDNEHLSSRGADKLINMLASRLAVDPEFTLQLKRATNDVKR